MEMEESRFVDLKEGDVASFSILITDELVDGFSKVSGNQNPLHADASYAGPPYGERVAHGMLAGALFSRLIGMQLPGLYSLCLSQSLNFRKPMHIGQEVIISGAVIQKSDATSTITLHMKATEKDSGDILADSEALVRVLE